MSDHRPVMCQLQLKKPKKLVPIRYTLARRWSDFDKIMFLHDLINQPWEKVISIGTNAHQQAQAMYHIMESTVERHAHLRKIKIRPHFKKGLSVKTKMASIKLYTTIFTFA